jgi:hypothetical protein
VPIRILRESAAVLFLLLLTTGLYWKLTISDQYTWLENPDQALQVLPWLDYEAREFHAGRMPLWDPYQCGGQSLIGQVQPGVVNPFNWILFAMPLRDGHIPIETLHWYWVLIHWVAAAFAYWLCRTLQAGVGASLVGGAVFAFAGFMGHALCPQFMMSALWIPVALLFFVRVFRGPRPLASSAMAGAALGLDFLGGHHNVPTYFTIVMGGLWAWYLLPRRRDRLAWRYAAVFAIVMVLVAAVQIVPAFEYGRQALRWSGEPMPQRWNDPVPYRVHTEYSLHARSIPGMVIPGLAVHFDPFVGIVALTFAIVAVVFSWRSLEVRLMALVALGGLLLALGPDAPVHLLAYKLIPMVEKARYPSMAIVISQIGIASLAALGIDAWRRAPSRAVAWWAGGFGAALFGIYCVLKLFHRPEESPAWTVAAVALALSAVLFTKVRNSVVVGGAALALVMVEVSMASSVRLPRRDAQGSYLKLMADQADIADFLKKQPGWFHVDFDEDVVPYNFGDWHGVDQFGGYLASLPIRFRAALGHPETAQMYGLSYRVGRKPADPAQTEVFQSRTGVKVYRDPRYGQALWTQHDTPCSGVDRLTLVSRSPASAHIRAEMACAGIVAEGETWYRGWVGSVDAARVPVRAVNGTVRGVAVNAGRHEIEIRYRPGSIYWGAALSLTGLLIALALQLAPKRERSSTFPLS